SGMAPWTLPGRTGDLLVDAKSGLPIKEFLWAPENMVQIPALKFGTDTTISDLDEDTNDDF
ncbi:MAG TPA: hypothetical protein VLM37_01800, partial [Fibrobacteraceae bacterium]|nr:hypothetical protein [Fibrobacteraceae bacterium]